MKFRYLFMFMSFVLLISCTKNVEKALDPSNNNARLGQSDETDSLEYYASLGSPTREVTEFLKNGGKLPNTLLLRDLKQYAATPKINNSYPYACGDPYTPLIINAPIGWGSLTSTNTAVSRQNNVLDNPFYLWDPFGNPINAVGIYGTDDDRQAYYVYCPPTAHENSPIVVLVHGGGWFSGPNFDYINGWNFAFSDPAQSQTKNLVKDLMTAGYVVVAPMYRLVQYAYNDNELLLNQIHISNQIDDIDAAINHVKSNFPECFGINANSIQILGESAGGQLALMWAYTKTTIPSTYIKSVISCYAPTNLQEYGNYLRNRPVKYNCGNVYYNFCTRQILSNLYPFYFFFEITNPNDIFNSISPFLCIPNGVNNIFCLNPNQITVLSNFRIIDSTYNLIQSASSTTPITNPLNNNTLYNYSPRYKLSTNRIIPTYIMHGGSDALVPYNPSTNGMNTQLTNNGGLIATLNNNNAITYNYSSGNKHLIQTFPGANHTWGNTTQATKDIIRGNIIQWLNGHK